MLANRSGICIANSETGQNDLHACQRFASSRAAYRLAAPHFSIFDTASHLRFCRAERGAALSPERADHRW
jgi:hypothetical protein